MSTVCGTVSLLKVDFFARLSPGSRERGFGTSQVPPVKTGGSCEILIKSLGGQHMKKLVAFVLTLVLLFACLPTVYAAEEKSFFFELSVDGGDTKQVRPGDIITVVFHLVRMDADVPYDMHAMQNEIRYDSNYLRLVEGSALLSDGIQTTDLGLRDDHREFYMNYLSLSGSEQWPVRRLVGSFQLEVIGTSGVTRITNQDYLVSSSEGEGSCRSVCQDVTVIISTDCTVTFETNGGSTIPAQTVRYGEKLQRPEDPVREGFHVEGWYTDIDLKHPWDFEKDTVQGNMTLYVKWAEGDPMAAVNGNLWIPGLILLVLFVLIFLLLGKKTVTFETGCRARIKKQRIRKGGYAEPPEDPVRPGRMFAGWYADEAMTIPWDFEADKVERNTKLYARWI